MAQRRKHRQVRPHRSRRLVLCAALLLAVVAACGTASAFWSANGEGLGSASTETALAVTLSPSTPAAELYPGASAAVVLTMSNAGAASVHVGTLALDTDRGVGGFSADAGHSACDVSFLAFTTASNGGAGWTVAGAVEGEAGTIDVSLPGALTMSLDAPDGCQGADITVYLAAGQ